MAKAEDELTAFRSRPMTRVMDLDSLRSHESRVQSAQREVEKGRYRDGIQATRPDGCFCLGDGGRSRRYLSSAIWGFEEYCVCPDGQRLEAEANAERERQQEDSKQRRIAELLDDAEIPARFKACTFSTYPATDLTRDVAARVSHWLNGPRGVGDDGDEKYESAWSEWEKLRRSLLLYGPFGTGKTGLAVAALRDHITDQLDDGLFTTVPSLLDQIRQSYAPDATKDDRAHLERVKQVDFLVLDDLGAERVTDWVAERLFVVINYRHDHNLPTIFTSNLSPGELAGHVGERTMWRIVEMAEVMKLDGPNLRDRVAQAKP